MRLSFNVLADGVDTWASVNVYANAVTAGGDPIESRDFYNSTLRPNDRGEIEQRISVPFSAPQGTWGIQISAVTAGGAKECESRSTRGPTCAVIELP